MCQSWVSEAGVPEPTNSCPLHLGRLGLNSTDNISVTATKIRNFANAVAYKYTLHCYTKHSERELAHTLLVVIISETLLT